MVEQAGGGLRHPAAQARRTGAPALAAEGDEASLGTVLAGQHGEAAAQKAALDVTLELAAHERRQRRASEAWRRGLPAAVRTRRTYDSIADRPRLREPPPRILKLTHYQNRRRA